MMFTLPPIVDDYLETLGPNNIVGVVCESTSCIVARAYEHAHPMWRHISFEETGVDYVDEHGLCQHLPADPDLVTIMELFDYSGDGGEVKVKEEWERYLERNVHLELAELFKTVRSVVTPVEYGVFYACDNY